MQHHAGDPGAWLQRRLDGRGANSRSVSDVAAPRAFADPLRLGAGDDAPQNLDVVSAVGGPQGRGGDLLPVAGEPAEVTDP